MPPASSFPRARQPGRLLVAVLLVWAALALAACGGGASKPQTTAQRRAR
jgi:hypothetical protein